MLYHELIILFMGAMARGALVMKGCLGVVMLLVSALQLCGNDVQDYPFIDTPSSAFGKKTGAPLVLSCRELPYALILNPSMNCGFVVDMDKMELHRMDDRCSIDVVYGGSWHGDVMEHPYDVGCIDGVRMYRHYFSLRDGNRVVYLNKQGKCLQQSLLKDNGQERVEYSFADLEPQECSAAFEQFSPAELYGDTAEHYCLNIREVKGAMVAYLLDGQHKELWHRELPAACADISWEEQRIGNGIFYVIGSKVYVPFKDGVTCISQEGIGNIRYECADSQDCITKTYACKMGPDDGVFIRLVLGAGVSFWDIVRINKDEVHRSKLALHDANGFLYQWVRKESSREKQAVVPEEITPQVAGNRLILLTGKGAKWEYTGCDASLHTLPQISSADPVFFHFSAYLKAYIAITKGAVDESAAGEYSARIPARIYFLR